MESGEPSDGFWNALRQRKLVQWALAYIAGAFALLQGVDIVAQRFAWPEAIERILILVLCIGFFVALVLAWYHGERGEQKVTRVELLILAALLAIGGVAVWRYAYIARPSAGATQADAASASATAIPAKSIAVLPFANMSGDAKNDYFSDGITEEILDALAQIPDLKVAARTSAFAFKGKAQDLRTVGETLGVATVLEGSVQAEGDAVRITAQLIDARSGFHLWSQKYDRKRTDIFAVEDEISKAIADKLQAQLAGGSGQTLVARKTLDPRAHELYLRGMVLLAARGPGMRDAADAFQQAVTLDPNYAQAWAGLAQAEALVWNWHYDTEGTAHTRAHAAAERALALDPDNAAAYVALGILYDDNWQWAQADRALRRAVELAPGDAEAIDQYAQFLLMTGQFEPALREIERANRLDPLSGIINSVHAQVLLALHRCDAAAAQAAHALAVAPHLRHASGVALYVDVSCKRYADAQEHARRFADAAGVDPAFYATLVRGLSDPAQREMALRLAKLSDFRVQGWGWEKAYWLLAFGDNEGALAAIEAHFADGPVGGTERLWHPGFDPIRNDPRFKAVLAKIGIPYRSAGDAGAPH
jgi:TolB-like protein/Tfp pilus assembly protein PilF